MGAARRCRAVVLKGSGVGQVLEQLHLLLAEHLDDPLRTWHLIDRPPRSGVGFTHLWERGRLDLTVEALVLQPDWRALFISGELGVARLRTEERYRRLSSKHHEIGRRSGHDPGPGVSEQSDLAPAIRGLDFC